jgi:branched-chain amino acid transport system permease protein
MQLSNMQFSNKWLRIVLLIVGLVLLSSLPAIIDPYILQTIWLVLFFCVVSEAFNIGMFAGIISLGSHGYIGLGAYTFALLATRMGLSFVPALLLGGILALLIMSPFFTLLRLKGAYLIAATFILPEVLVAAIVYLRDLTGGAVGIILPVRSFSGLFAFLDYYLMLILTIAVILVSWYLSRSKYMYAFNAIYDDEDSAKMLGVNTTKYQVIAFAISIFFSALAGALWAYSKSYIDPYMVFSGDDMLLVVLATFLGGVRRTWGPIIGASFLVIVSELLRLQFSHVHEIVLGILIIVVCYFLRDGLIGTFPHFWSKLKKWLNEEK